jgi:hypothetical protein
MPGIFSFSNEAVSSFGNPHSLAMEDNGLAPPRHDVSAPRPDVSGDTHAYSHQAKMTDAVIAASKVLNDVKSNSSIMGDDLDMAEVKNTDALVRAMASGALAKKDLMGPARLVRLGLFVDEYGRFRQAVAMKQVLDDVIKQRSREFHQRAAAWGNEIINAGQPQVESATAKVPWKKIAIFGGLAVALGLGVNYYMTWKKVAADS